MHGEEGQLEFHHVSILLQECIDSLRIRPDGVYVDATLGVTIFCQYGRLYNIFWEVWY